MDDCTKKFIERNIELIEQEKLNILYDNAESDILNRRLIPGNMRELTHILKDVFEYEPIEHPSMHAIPSFYRILDDIESLRIPDHIERIKGSAFKNCGRLKEITIPKSVVQIYDQAFLDCNNLNRINYLGTKKEWDKIIIDYTAFTASGLPANIRVICIDGEVTI
jgi:hypothetical protein